MLSRLLPYLVLLALYSSNLACGQEIPFSGQTSTTPAGYCLQPASYCDPRGLPCCLYPTVQCTAISGAHVCALNPSRIVPIEQDIFGGAL
ncbi:hypothetical protein GE061_005304 [Apolygus lucorum]|uniref:Uncharacterized protein n=1 Tax=Apolygus lucorum TaxID=248454 RepID=A0A6A4IYK0_APOLU|nr:hypothetical protein GE061_005304 [Apolygus lucorum]